MIKPRSDYDKYLAKSQTMIRLQKIFYGLFYEKDIYYLRPTVKQDFQSFVGFSNKVKTDFFKNSIDQISHLNHLYGIPKILNSLAYCFKSYEQF